MLFSKATARAERFADVCASYAEFEMRRRVLRHGPVDLGRWTRDRLARMGPTFIKIGQFLSTRSDVLGDEFTRPLRDLCENVSPLPYADVSRYAEAIGESLVVNPDPVASASIAQVHRGELGENRVAIKIKRPGIATRVSEDFETLLFGVDLLKRVTSDHRVREFEVLFREYYDILRYEIDFRVEVRNLERYAERARHIKGVRVPRPFVESCTDDVIVMDYLESIRVDDVDGLKRYGVDAPDLASRLANLMLRSILELGMVHIDPHPGNLGVSTDDGSIVLYDFGMMLDLGPDVQDQLMKLFFAIADRDVKAIRTVAVDMGMVLVDPADVPVFDRFLSSMIVYLDTSNFEAFRTGYLADQRGRDVPFMLSSKFVLLMRGLSIMEGVCKRLDPDFNAQRAIEVHFRNRFTDVRYLESRALADVRSLWTVPTRVDDTAARLDLLERTVNDAPGRTRRDERVELLRTAWSAVATATAVWLALNRA